MNLRAPTVVRLKRTLAHWSSRVTVRVAYTEVADGTRVPSRLSLLTVRAMPTEVKPERPALSSAAALLPHYLAFRTSAAPLARGTTIVEHARFPTETRADDLGCGKLSFTESPPRLTEAGSPADGEAAVAGETVHGRNGAPVRTMRTSLWTTTAIFELSTSYGQAAAEQ